jgi:hypothetical protein
MLLEALTWTALGMSVVAFGVFVVLSVRRSPTIEKSANGVDLQPHGALSELTELAKALHELTESFQKAGPALSALVASILFFLIATLGLGSTKLRNNLRLAAGVTSTGGSEAYL